MGRMTLKAARVNAGLTQLAAADYIGVTKKTISLWENGKTTPKVDKIDALCKLYKISYDNINFLPANNA